MLVCEPIDLQLAAPCFESLWLPELVSGPEVAEMAWSAKNNLPFWFCNVFCFFQIFSSYDEIFFLR